MNRLNLRVKTQLTPNDELELACLLDIDDGIILQHRLLCDLFRAYQYQKNKIQSLEQWIKTLERQLERYKHYEKAICPPGYVSVDGVCQLADNPT